MQVSSGLEEFESDIIDMIIVKNVFLNLSLAVSIAQNWKLLSAVVVCCSLCTFCSSLFRPYC